MLREWKNRVKYWNFPSWYRNVLHNVGSMAMHKIMWRGLIIFNNCFQTLKKELLWTSSTSKPDFSASVAAHVDAYLETVLLQEKKSFFCESSKVLKNCLLLKWAAQSLKLCGSILLLKWIIKNYSGCRTWKTTTLLCNHTISLFSRKRVITLACLVHVFVLTVEAQCLRVGGQRAGKKERKKFSTKADLSE